MSLWLTRAGKYGEHEKKFLEENRIYLTWRGLAHDLTSLKEQKELRTLYEETYPDASKHKISNNVGQIWRFCKEIHPGDWIIVPSKQRSSIHVARVEGEYVFNPNGEDPYHYRAVEWIAQDVPRSNSDQDILYSFGAPMTICRIHRNDAERRVHEMAANGWESSGAGSAIATRGEATQFFRVRLWDQGDIIDQVLANYQKLDEEIKTQLPLKRIWVVNEPIE